MPLPWARKQGDHSECGSPDVPLTLPHCVESSLSCVAWLKSETKAEFAPFSLGGVGDGARE
jgi:hypothetical protein